MPSIIWAGDASLSNYYNFFSPYDPLPIAPKKWKDFTGDDYTYFLDSFISNDFESLMIKNWVLPCHKSYYAGTIFG